MLKQINFGDVPVTNAINEAQPPKNTVGFDLSINAIFILIQTVCSCLAGVYNEYLLKDKSQECFNIYMQNVFMYLDSILCNGLLLMFQGNILSAFSANSMIEILKPGIILIAVNNCLIGIVTSFFLKYLNSILKTFAGALELLFTAVFCWILFSIPIYFNTILSIVVVSLAVYLYSQSPVVNVKETGKKGDDPNRRALLADDNEDDILTMDEVIVKKI